MKRFIVSLALMVSLISTCAWADRAQYVPDIIVTEPGAVQTDIRAFASWAAAMTAIEASTTPTTLIISQDTTVSTTDDCPAYVTLKFVAGATITVSGGGKLTIKGPIEAGPYQIFNDTDAELATNYVVFTGNTSIDKIYPQWWGANANDSGSTDCHPAIQNAVFAAASLPKNAGDLVGGTVYYIPGTYATTDTIYANKTINGTYVDGITHVGENFRASRIIMSSTTATGPIIKFGDSSTTTYGCRLSGLTIQRFSAPTCMTTPGTCGTPLIGVHVDDCDAMQIDNVMVLGDGGATAGLTCKLHVGIRYDSCIYLVLRNSHILSCADQGVYLYQSAGQIEECWIEYNGLGSLSGGNATTCSTSIPTPIAGESLQAAGILVGGPGGSPGYIRNNEIYRNYIGIAQVFDAPSNSGGKIFENDIDSNLKYGVLSVNGGDTQIQGNFFGSPGGDPSDVNSPRFWHEDSTCFNMVFSDATTNATGSVVDYPDGQGGMLIKDNHMYCGIDGTPGSGLAGQTIADEPRGIYIGNNNTKFIIDGNYMRSGYSFINAANHTGTGSYFEIFLRNNIFDNEFAGTTTGSYGVILNDHLILYDLNNIYINLTDDVSGTAKNGSVTPWAVDYAMLNLDRSDNANYSGYIYYKDTNGVYNWIMQANDKNFTAYVDADAVTSFWISNTASGKNTDLYVDGAIAGGAEGVTISSSAGDASANYLTTFVTTDGGGNLDTITLANGSVSGQIKIINCTAKGAAGDTLAVYSASGFVGGNTITFSPLTVNDSCILIWNGATWSIITMVNGVLS